MRLFFLTVLTFLCSYSAYAQATPEKLTPWTGITLTQEQRTKVQTLNKGITAEIEALKKDSVLERRERFLKMKAVREKQDAGFRAILTPEQYARKNENVEKIKNKKKQ